MFAGVGEDPDTELLFEALANPRRRRLYELLCEQPRYPSELERELGEVTPAAISRHLRILGRARLIYAVSDTFPHVRYQSDREQLLYLRAWLAKVERDEPRF